MPLAFFPRLLKADQGQREHYELSGGGTGIHWDDLDEDISVEGLLLGVGDRTRRHLEPSRESGVGESRTRSPRQSTRAWPTSFSAPLEIVVKDGAVR